MVEPTTRLSAFEQSERIRRGELSPAALVRDCLDRIERYDGTLRAWISVDGERALEAGHRAERELAEGNRRGPLHGLPYGVKDQLHAEGFKTTLGTRVLDDAEMDPPTTATAIARLEAQGAILLGKQNLHEFGKGGTLDFPFGQPRNPWHPAYTASSSSSGSGIAVAACMCAFSLGEDTGGSIRGPASLNGVVGLRPTFGRVSRHGGVMAAYTSDTIGPLARSVDDVALVLAAIAGADPHDPLTSDRPVDDYAAALGRSVRGLRLGVVAEMAENDAIDRGVREAFVAAVGVLRAQGAVVETVSLPLVRFAVPLQLLSADADVAAWFLSRYLRDRYDRFDMGTRTRLAAASLIPATVYNRAMRARVLVRRQVLAATKDFDALLSPTMLTPTKRIEDAAERVDSSSEAVTRLMERRIGLYPFSLANVPALSLPMGFDAAGLPLGLQVAARPFAEAMVLQVASAYERAAGFAGRVPDLDVTLRDRAEQKGAAS